MNYIIIAGVRPQYIKARALVDTLNNTPSFNGRIYVVDTGQHYSANLSTEIIQELALHIDHHVIHKENATALEIISWSLISIEQFILSNSLQNAKVIVFGDANPTLVGTLIALKMGLRLIHIEAGARRDEKEQEHHNSRLTDCIAGLKLCVTERALNELKAEGNDVNAIYTGDLAYTWFQKIVNQHTFDMSKKTNNKKNVLITLHRPDNMTEEIVHRIYTCVTQSDLKITWVTHPRSASFLRKYYANAKTSFIPPQSFIKILNILSDHDILLTDSGGLSREAHFLKKPVLMRRDKGGWPELEALGVLRNIANTEESILAGLDWAKHLSGDYPEFSPLHVENGIENGIHAIINF